MQRSDFYAMTRDSQIKREDYSVNSYLEILDDNLLEIYESDFIFMQNNVLFIKSKKF